ncbi:hypothetical protein PybrP1_001199 [[Pythium] brassicae (nom. inval.)]|nr:hypothetical protein PybrP1_001199 [[Pythium] brassicae (nom. inval.)]
MCASTLYVKFLATTMIQGRKAFAAGSRAPEDNKLLMAKGQPAQSFSQSNGGGDSATVNCLLLGAYTTARVSHTLSFAAQKLRARMGFWLVGIACILGTAVNGVVAALA